MNLTNLQFETELLESLDWSNEKLKELYDYFDVNLNNEILIHPKVLLKEIEDRFGFLTKNVCQKIFKQIALKNNLHQSGGTIEN